MYYLFSQIYSADSYNAYRLKLLVCIIEFKRYVLFKVSELTKDPAETL